MKWRVKVIWKRFRYYWGWAYPAERRVELDPRMSDRMLLRIKPHEFAHIYFPDAPEYVVKAFGIDVGKSLYEDGFRRNHEDDE
jgi:hypothetical protein